MSDHRLPTAEHEAVYADIERKYLPRAHPQERPRAIITGGQPGSGKSGITSAAQAELAGQGGYVLVDADKLRDRHRDYQRLMQEDDRTAANKTHADAGAWAGRLYRAARDSHRNLIIDQTSKDPAALVALVKTLDDAGYAVEFRAMAVDSVVSEQRIHMRYESQKAAAGVGRFSTKDNHDHAYVMLPKSIEAAEASPHVQSVMLFDKNNRVIYANQRDGQHWQHPPEAAKAMATERAHSPSLDDRHELAAGYDRIAAMMAQPERKATSTELSVVGTLREQAHREATAETFRQWVPEQAVAAYPESL